MVEASDGGEQPDRPKGRDDVVFRSLAEDWVIYDPETDRLHVLNLAASIVWTSADGSRTVGEIVESVRNAFGQHADRPDVEEDVLEALLRFRDEGLLAPPTDP